MSSALADPTEIQPLQRSFPGPNGETRFGETAFVRQKLRHERLARALLLGMTGCIILPLIVIVGFLFYKAWPMLSWDFLFRNPRNGMRAGGVWSPLLGTFYLVITSLLISAPIGVLAGTFLAEFGRGKWLTDATRFISDVLLSAPSILIGLFVFQVAVKPVQHFSA